METVLNALFVLLFLTGFIVGYQFGKRSS